MPTLLVIAALLAAQAPALPDQLVISVVVTDRKGKPIEDLSSGEVTVKEGGSTLPVTRLERDIRPLKVAIVADTSGEMGGTFQADTVPAIVSLLKRLPAESVFSIWTTTDRPKLLVEEGTDVAAAEARLRTTPTLGNNAAIETVVAASQAVSQSGGHRSAVILITSASMGAIATDVQALLPKASLKPTYIAVEFVKSGGQGDARLQDSIRLLVNRTAGFHERVYSTMALETQLRRATDHLGGQYRLAWKPSVDPRQAKIEVRIGRKDTRVVQAMRLSTAW